MKLINVTARLSIVERKGFDPRFNLIVELPDLNATNSKIGKNYSTMELMPSKPLNLGDVQYLLRSKGQIDLINTTKNFRFKDCKAEAGIGHYKESGDPYYFVRVYLLEDLVKTCYLTPSQVKSLKFMNLGFEFEEDANEVMSKEELVVEDQNNKKK